MVVGIKSLDLASTVHCDVAVQCQIFDKICIKDASLLSIQVKSAKYEG